MPPEENRESELAAARQRFEGFVQKLEAYAAGAEKNAKVMDDLWRAISHQPDGLISAVDDLADEIRGLREDLRVAAKGAGIAGIVFARLVKR